MPVDDAPDSKNEPGEFTRFFQGAGQPVAPPPPRTRPEEPEPAASASAPGEFTRVFGSSKTGEASRDPETTRSAPPAPALATKAPAEAIPPATSNSALSHAGETTRAFTRVPQPQRPERGANPPVPPSKQGPGEFTRAFASPATHVPANRDAATERKPETAPAPSEPAAPAPRQTPSDFTKMFRSPFASSTDAEVNWKEIEKQSAPPPPKHHEPGEFTKFFSGDGQRNSQKQASDPSKRAAGELFSTPRTGRETSTRGFEEDAFAAVVAGSLATPPASALASDPALQSPPPGTATPVPAKKSPPLTLLLVVIGLVLLLAAAAAYFLVFRS